jgi:hypothetical protein
LISALVFVFLFPKTVFLGPSYGFKNQSVVTKKRVIISKLNFL